MGNQPSRREDGFGTEGIGDNGDGSMGQTNSGGGGTGATGHGHPRGSHNEEGASAKQDGSVGRQNEANKQGAEGTGVVPQD